MADTLQNEIVKLSNLDTWYQDVFNLYKAIDRGKITITSQSKGDTTSKNYATITIKGKTYSAGTDPIIITADELETDAVNLTAWVKGTYSGSDAYIIVNGEKVKSVVEDQASYILTLPKNTKTVQISIGVDKWTSWFVFTSYCGRINISYTIEDKYIPSKSSNEIQGNLTYIDKVNELIGALSELKNYDKTSTIDKKVYYQYSSWAYPLEKKEKQKLITDTTTDKINELKALCVNDSITQKIDNKTYTTNSTLDFKTYSNNSTCGDNSVYDSPSYDTPSYDTPSYDTPSPGNSTNSDKDQDSINGNCPQNSQDNNTTNSVASNQTCSKNATNDNNYSTCDKDGTKSGFSGKTPQMIVLQNNYTLDEMLLGAGTCKTNNTDKTLDNKTATNVTWVIQYAVKASEIKTCSNIDCYKYIE